VGELRVLRSRPRDGDAQRLHRPLVVPRNPVLNDAAQAPPGAESRHQVPGELTEIGQEPARFLAVERLQRPLEALPVARGQPADPGGGGGADFRREHRQLRGEDLDLDLEIARLTEAAPQSAERALDRRARFLLEHRTPQPERRAEPAGRNPEIVDRFGIGRAAAMFRGPLGVATELAHEAREVGSRRGHGGAAEGSVTGGSAAGQGSRRAD